MSLPLLTRSSASSLVGTRYCYWNPGISQRAGLKAAGAQKMRMNVG